MPLHELDRHYLHGCLRHHGLVVLPLRDVQRIAVVGGPGSGKSTLAASIARAARIPHIELDALWWEPGWTPAAMGTFQLRVKTAVAGQSWIIEGFYVDEAAEEFVWPVADVILWLDLPRHVSVRRALGRSVTRVIRRTELWGTNTQPASVLTPVSLVRFIHRWPAYPARIEKSLAPLIGIRAVRLKNDRAAYEWLRQWSAVRGAESEW